MPSPANIPGGAKRCLAFDQGETLAGKTFKPVRIDGFANGLRLKPFTGRKIEKGGEPLAAVHPGSVRTFDGQSGGEATLATFNRIHLQLISHRRSDKVIAAQLTPKLGLAR